MVDFKSKTKNKKSSKETTEKPKNKYLQKILNVKKQKEEQENNKGKKKPRAAYQTLPFFTIPDKKADLYFGIYNDVPIEPEDPLYNESDENYLVYRFHYIEDGVKGINGRKERYVYCPRSIDRDARCALCETYNAVWQIRIRELEESDPERKTLRNSAAAFRPQTRYGFPILNLSLLNKKAPDCFTVQGELDVSTEKCQKCPWQDACYRGHVGVEIFGMGPTLKTNFDELAGALYGYEDEDSDEEDEDEEEEKQKFDYDGEHWDFDNCVVFRVYKTKKGEKTETKLKVVETGKQLPEEYKKIWEDTMPEQLELLFTETHTYSQMLAAVPKKFRKDLSEYLDQKGLDLIIDIEDDEDEDKPKNKKNSNQKTKRRKVKEEDEEDADEVEDEEDEEGDDDNEDEEEDEEDDDEEEQRNKKTTNRKNKKISRENDEDEENSDDSEYESSELKECFADEDVFDEKSKKCVKCHLFEQCGDVIDGSITKKEAIKLLSSSSKKENKTVKSKFSRNIKKP